MAKNRRSGNNNAVDTAVYGNDAAELLNEESARLISGSMNSDNTDKLKKTDHSSKPEAEETAELSANLSNGFSRRAKQDDLEHNTADKSVKQAKKSRSVPEKSGEAAAGAAKRVRKVKQAGTESGTSNKPVKRPAKSKSASGKSERADEGIEPGAADKPGKGTRKSKLITERAVAEITEDTPQKLVHRLKTDIAVSVEKTAVVPKKRGKKALSAAEDDSSVEEKASEQEDGSGLGGCKTRQVMKLIEGDSENLVVFAGKSRVPSLLRGRESLSAMMRRNALGAPKCDDTEVVNITELTIRYEAAGILDRFNACSCEKCVNVFSEIIAEKIPVRYARISRAELDSGELPERAVPMRQIVLPEMIRQLIFNKKRCFHD